MCKFLTGIPSELSQKICQSGYTYVSISARALSARFIFVAFVENGVTMHSI